MPRKCVIDLKKVESLASRGITREQVAHNLGISSKTLQRHSKENPEIEEAYLRGKSLGITTIANALFEKAKQGNTTAQIFFLKCNGWREENSINLKVDEKEKSLKDLTDDELKSELAKYEKQ